jgi:thiamine-phosphate pyrophosphorylase
MQARRVLPCNNGALHRVRETPMELPHPPLLLVTDRRQARQPLAAVVAAALAAGCRWVSVREKDLPEDEQLGLVRMLRPIAKKHGALLMLHGEAALAQAAGADGVHLPAGSDPVAVRAMLGPDKLIGVSIHTVTEAEAIAPGSADYAIAGPAYETASKPGYGPEIGRKGLGDIARAAKVPLIAIGGLNATRAAEVLAAGVVGIAVMGSIMRAADPEQEMKALLATVARR